jgi:hypothetical protein
MATDLPDYYFRVRDNGATVFRVDTENRQRRIEMNQIAVVNVRNGEIKPQGDRPLTEADVAAIQGWMADRVTLLAQRDIDDIHRAVDYLNQRRAVGGRDRPPASGDARSTIGAGAQESGPADETRPARGRGLGLHAAGLWRRTKSSLAASKL